MKKFIFVSLLFIVSIANSFAQDTLKTNLRVKLMNNVEIPEKLNCQFILSEKCDYIVFDNIDLNMQYKIFLSSLEKEIDLDTWKIYTYKTNNNEIVTINYENNKLLLLSKNSS